MLTFLQKLLKFSALLVLITLLVTVYFTNLKSDTQTVGTETFDLKQQVYVSLSPFPVVAEEEIHVQLRLAEPLQKSNMQVDAWIEGVNMYMGKSTVFFEQIKSLTPITSLKPIASSNSINGVFFLGSCSVPKMQWRFYLKITNKKGEEDIMSFDFFTDFSA